MTPLAPQGYRTPEGRHAYARGVILLLIAYGVLQFAAPVVTGVAIFAGVFGVQSDFTAQAHLSRGAYWRGEWWYSVWRVSQFGTHYTEIHSISPEAGSEETFRHRFKSSIKFTPGSPAELLADGESLLILSPDSRSRLGDSLEIEDTTNRKASWTGRAFVMDGRPHVIAERNGATVLMELGDEDVVRTTFTTSILPPRGSAFQGLHVLPDATTLHLFAVTGGTLEYGTVPADDPNGTPVWTLVTRQVTSLAVVMLDGTPAVVVSEGMNPGAARVVTYHLQNGTWTTVASVSAPSTMEVAAWSDGETVRILSHAFFGPMRLLEVGDGGVVSDTELQNKTGFENLHRLTYLAMIPQGGRMILTLLLAVVLSNLMMRHRVPHIETGGRMVTLASPLRRGLAQIVDLFIALAPYGIALGLCLPVWLNPTKLIATAQAPIVIFGMMGGMLAAFAWIPLCYVLFSFLEGRYGWTPGKLLFRIRVFGTDLHACGFGRAFLRNLLRIADGLFGYVLGLALVAFNTKWQRLGDMAADTIVVGSGSFSASEPEAGTPSPLAEVPAIQ